MPYEASQLAISFVARKKKVLGLDGTSSIVFSGVKLLCDKGAYSDAGTLMQWFIEDGAGDDYKFHIETDSLKSNKNKYCDIQRLSDFLSSIPSNKALSFVEKIYGPVHVLILKNKKTQDSELVARLNLLEQIFAGIFETNKDWYNAL